MGAGSACGLSSSLRCCSTHSWIVTVGRCLGRIRRDKDYRAWIGTRWEVDRAIHAHNTTEGIPSNIYAKHIAEACLMRIDGYEIDSDEESMTEENILEEAF